LPQLKEKEVLYSGAKKLRKEGPSGLPTTGKEGTVRVSDLHHTFTNWFCTNLCAAATPQ